MKIIKLHKITVVFIAILLYSLNAMAQTFEIKSAAGHEFTYKPSITQRLSGTREVVLVVPRQQSTIDQYFYTCISNYFRRIGVPIRTYSARFRKNTDNVGNIRVVWGTLEEDISDSWENSNTLLIVANVVSSFGYYRGEENFAQISIIDPVNDYTWEFKFDMPNKEEKFDKKLKELISSSWNYNADNLIRPKIYWSNWKEIDFKKYFSSSNYHPIEGVYEGDNYKVGIKQGNDGKFYAIYLDGASNNVDWREGDVKALLQPTATPTIFKATWFGKWKQSMNFTIVFKDGLMTTYDEDKTQEAYLKLYPALLSQAQNNTAEWSGTGFALKDGYIVTNYHVVEDAKVINVQGVKGNFDITYKASIVAIDKYNDLALLRISDDKFNGFGAIPYNIKTSVSEVGEDVFVLGYPLTSTMGDEIKLTTGVISSKTGFQGDVSLYQISAPIQPGNSGGPLFDNRGNLIGIVNAKHKGAENVGYAIKTSYLNNLIESSISTSILPNNNQIAGLPLTGKVKSLKNYVFMITCSNAGSSSAYSASPSTSASIKTIEYPTVSRTTAKRAKIKSVKLVKDYTAIEITSNNQSGNSYYQWCNIDRNTYILVNGTRYTLTRTDGIEIAPEKTYFSYAGQDITFTLYFPPISDTATSIDLIESIDSEWKFYGIEIR